jgi:hypothetical protein
MASHFEYQNDPTGARLGRLVTAHGVVRPRLYACGYSGNSKGDAAQRFEEMGCQICLVIPITSISAQARADPRIGRPASLHELGWTDFDRQRRLPSLQPRCDAKLSEEGFAFNLISMALIISYPRERRSDSRGPRSDIAMVLDECIPTTRTGSMFGIPRQERFAGLNVVCERESTIN